VSIPVDLNFFSDRTRDGLGVLVPSEGDVIAGVTSTWRLGPGALEVGSRAEHDRPLDRGGITQSYVDVRARYLYSLEEIVPPLRELTRGGDVAGWLTLGGFVFNPTYPARPDNSGRALLRSAAHVELSGLEKHFAVGVDGAVFSDRRAANPLLPSELDATAEVVGRMGRFEAQLAYERDMPVDRGGLVQELVYVTLSAVFDLKR
jgi:hypothetical protein